MSLPAVPSRLAIPWLVAGAFFMENLDGTVIVTALPQMAASFGVAPADMSIGLSAYLLTLAALIPASGWMADRFGARRVFAAAIAGFTLASVACALSTSLAVFVAARIAQGAAGAMMVPVGRLAVLNATPKPQLIRAIATITWPGLAAPVLGPPLGGLIATQASWHWIFLLNVPLGVLGLVLALRWVPHRQARRAAKFDLHGFVLVALACLLLLAGLEWMGQVHAIGSGGAVLAAGALCGLLAWRHVQRMAQPILDFSALRMRSFAVTVGGGSLFRVAIGAVPFLLPLMLQLAFGLDAFHSGLLVLAVFAGNLAMKPLTTPLLRRFHFRDVLLVNGLANALAIAACGLLTPATPAWAMAALLFVSGLARSMQFTALNTLAFAEVPPARMSGANTLFNTAQQLAMGVGIAIGALLLQAAAWWAPGDAGTPSLAAFHIAFVLTGGLCLLSTLDVLGLERRAGEGIRRPAPGPRENDPQTKRSKPLCEN